LNRLWAERREEVLEEEDEEELAEELDLDDIVLSAGRSLGMCRIKWRRGY
jgi:hypothetical protein